MNLKRRIEQLEQQAGLREARQDQERLAKMSDEELDFRICHGCSPQDLQGKISREVRQYTENELRATIIVESMD